MANPIDPTPIDPPVSSIIKSDRTGRTRYTRQYKQEVLDAFESSSLSAPAFARHCGIKYPTFGGCQLSVGDIFLFSRRICDSMPPQPESGPQTTE